VSFNFHVILEAYFNKFLCVKTKITNIISIMAEMVSRPIACEGSKMIIRGLIEGGNADCKGHLECRGLHIDDEAFLQSIPELIARKKGLKSRMKRL
jgi:hypothetical protein